MISLAALLARLKTALGLVEAADDLIDVTVEALDPEPTVKGRPMSHRDVEHQQAQIRAATRPPRKRKR